MNTPRYNTYAGIPEEYAELSKSKVVLIPVPFDETSTWGKGADGGPNAFLEASENMELYDIETKSEAYKHGVYLSPPIEEKSSPEAMVSAVHKAVKSFLNRGKTVTLFGGEHSISIGAMRAMHEHHSNLSILQLDAHADLRKTYLGSSYNHACALYEANENMPVVQVGIRSMDSSEKTVMNEENVFFAHEISENDYWMDQVLDALTDTVYITFDLDAFDPSVLPSTGTPEPGGLLWYETLTLLRKVFREKKVVGWDIVELCPKGDFKASAFAAAKLYYKMLSYSFEEKEEIFPDEPSVENTLVKGKLSKTKHLENE